MFAYQILTTMATQDGLGQHPITRSQQGKSCDCVERKSKPVVTYTLKKVDANCAYTHFWWGGWRLLHRQVFLSRRCWVVQLEERILNCKVRSFDGTDLLPEASLCIWLVALMSQLRVKQGYYFFSFKQAFINFISGCILSYNTLPLSGSEIFFQGLFNMTFLSQRERMFFASIVKKKIIYEIHYLTLMMDAVLSRAYNHPYR